MNDLPKKLLKWLDSFEGDRNLQIVRFKKYYELARQYAFQSPRFWAMRQILSQNSDHIIDQKIKKRLSKNKSKT